MMHHSGPPHPPTPPSTQSAPSPQSPHLAGRLGEILVNHGLITKAQLHEALAKKQAEYSFLGQALVELRYIDERTLTTFLVKQCKIPHINLLDYQISEKVAALVPLDLCRKHHIVPVDLMGRMLTIAMVDPLDTAALNAVQELHPQLRIKPILCEWRHFDAVLKKIYPDEGKPLTAIEATDFDSHPDPLPFSTDNDIPEVTAIDDGASSPGPQPTPEASAPLPRAPADAGQAPAAELLAELKRAVEELTESARMSRMSRAAEGAALIDEIRQSIAKLGRTLSKEISDRISETLTASPQPADTPKMSPTAGPRPNLAVIEFKNPAERLAEADAKILRALEAGEMLGPYVFDDFFPGKANEFALAAAKAVAEAPGDLYNPLFVYGEVGVGKTHLTHAIANTIVVKHPGLRVAAVSAGLFANQIEHPSPEHEWAEIRRHYAGFDVLLIDDIQLLAEHPTAQNEFFHLFNALHLHRRQIIISADNPPERLGLVDKRLASRFAGGIVLQLKPPDWDARLAILQGLAGRAGVTISRDVLTVLATRVQSDVRKLTGALRKVAAYARLEQVEITPEAVGRILAELGIEDAA